MSGVPEKEGTKRASLKRGKQEGTWNRGKGHKLFFSEKERTRAKGKGGNRARVTESVSKWPSLCVCGNVRAAVEEFSPFGERTWGSLIRTEGRKKGERGSRNGYFRTRKLDIKAIFHPE